MVEFLKKKKNILALLSTIFTVILSVGITYFLIMNNHLYVDESGHYKAIINFLHGNFSREDSPMSTVPGYNLFMAAISYITGLHSIPMIRLFNLLLSLLLLPVFFLLRKKMSGQDDYIRTMQLFLFPILFPFFFLIYTDVFSLLLVLLSTLFFEQRKHLFAAIFGIFSMTVRQNNVLWLLLMITILFFEESNLLSYFNQSGQSFLKKGKDFLSSITNQNFIKKLLSLIWPYLIGILLFSAYIIINKGVAYAAEGYSPFLTFHLGNIYFILFLVFILLLPYHVANLLNIIKLIIRRWWVILLLAALFIVFYRFVYFVPDHPNNYYDTTSFLRNWIMHYFISNKILKIVFYLAVFLSCLSLAATKFEKKSWYLIYPFTFVFLASSWMIEQRYYLIPFSLFLVMKKRESIIVETITIIWFLGITLFLMNGILTSKFFL